MGGKKSTKRLLEMVCSKQCNFEILVDDWIMKYSKNKPSATLEVIQILFDASGHNKKLTVNVLEEEDIKSLIEHLQSTMPNERDAPISDKRVQVCLAVFFQRLAQKCNDFLYDGYLLDTLLGFITGLCNDTMRAFRLVGTLVGLKLMTALVNVLVVVHKSVSTARRQEAAEKARENDSPSRLRIEMLQKKSVELQNKEVELTRLLQDFLMKIVFKPGILDKMVDIQILCLNELFLWMEMYPEMFMINELLAYNVLLIRSPDVTVRRTILKLLIDLFKKNLYKEELKIFSEKFVSSLITMTRDVSIPVSVLALTLLINFLESYGNQIIEKHTDEIFHLVFSKHLLVAREAGIFLLTWMKAQEDMNESASNVTVLVNLTVFFEEAGLPEHAPFLTDALLPNCSALGDWEAMCSLLVHPLTELTAAQETSFMKIMSASVDQLCTGKSPRNPKKNINMKMKAVKKREKCALELTEHFEDLMPRLLHKYRDDSEKVSLLLNVVMHFSLNQDTPPKQKVTEMLVKSIENIIDIHSEKKVLRSCCDVVRHLSSECLSPTDPCYLLWSSFKSRYMTKFTEAVKETDKCTERNVTPNADQIFKLSDSLEKLVIFSENWDLDLSDIWGIVVNYIARVLQTPGKPVAFIVNCIKMCHLNIMWNRKSLDSKNVESITADDVKLLQKKILQLLDVLEKLLFSEQSAINRCAFFTVCDLLLIFCEDCSNKPFLANLGTSANVHLQSLLQKYVENLVFRGDYRVQVKSGITLECKQAVLEAYCKLVSYSMLEMDAAGWIFKYYNRIYKDYEQIMKKTFTNMLETDEIECVDVLMKVLSHTFVSLVTKKKQDDPKIRKNLLKNFQDKFSILFVHLAEYPSAVEHFHKLVIQFAYQADTTENNLLFLEVLSPFLEILSVEQCSSLLEILRRQKESVPQSSSSSSKYEDILSQKVNSLTPRKKIRPSKQANSL